MSVIRWSGWALGVTVGAIVASCGNDEPVQPEVPTDAGVDSATEGGGGTAAGAGAAGASGRSGASGAGGTGGTVAGGGAGGVSGNGGAGASGGTGGTSGAGGGAGSGGSEQGPPLRTGWWIDVNTPGPLAGFAEDGGNLILGTSAGWYAQPWMRYVIQDFLDAAHTYEMKVILGMTTGWTSAQDFSDTIAQFANHPALDGWYLADEPEIQANAAELLYGLSTDPGYFSLTHTADPNHPAFISFNMVYDLDVWNEKARPFYAVTDMLGMHNYPFWSTDPEPFGGGDARAQVDKWRLLLQDTHDYGKVGCVATCQGFGDNSVDPYRTPTLDELRYQAFTAVAVGIDRVLFWMYHDDWSGRSPEAVANVREVMGQLRSVGGEIVHGVTSDPRITVQAPAESLVYRYGVSGSRHAIVAVNIASRERASGATLSDVSFTLPESLHVAEVRVLSESRSMAVSSGVFTDSFAPFAVHLYQFDSAN